MAEAVWELEGPPAESFPSPEIRKSFLPGPQSDRAEENLFSRNGAIDLPLESVRSAARFLSRRVVTAVREKDDASVRTLA